MRMVLPADSTRMASVWSSRVSTPSTGVTIVRSAGIVTDVYTAMLNMYTAGAVAGDRTTGEQAAGGRAKK
jgi:hypothetical protein